MNFAFSRIAFLISSSFLLDVFTLCRISLGHQSTVFTQQDCSKYLPRDWSPSSNGSELVYLDPLLHLCFKDHPYNTAYLPIRSTERLPIELEYRFYVNHLIHVSENGRVTLTINLALYWTDEFRQWDQDVVPIDEV